jgi:cell division protein FtsI/penicillin-binding protein 2
LDGSDVILTIDRGIQTIVEEELDLAVARYRPQAAVIIFVRPHTGEVLAMGSRPTFDPRKPADAPTRAQINHAVSSVFEPGSTFKIVTVGAALNEGIVDLETEIFCENGKYSYAGHVLGDHRSYGDLTVREIVTQSSNIGVAKLGIQIGQKRFYNYIRRFGFAFKTGIELPGELAGILAPPEAWSGVSIAQIPMGQGIGVTPLQMVTAMNVIASGGKLVAPRLVDSLVDPTNPKPHRLQPVVRRQVISPRAAADLSIALEENTREEGTGTLAAVPGFRTAGKTGTAQKIDPETKSYAKGRYVVSFAGFLPAEDPKLCGIVLFDEADVNSKEYYGGQIAAPVFSRVAARIATYLNLRSRVSPTAINSHGGKGDRT